MRILIDGYNLIRAVPGLSRLDRDDLQAGREALLGALASYRALRRHPLTVVFDGSLPGSAPGGPPSHRGIPVLFSRAGQSADDLLAAKCRAGEADLLVSSDAGLASRVGRSVEVVRSDEFWESLELALLAEAKGAAEGRGAERKGGEPGIPGRRRSKRERRGSRAKARL